MRIPSDPDNPTFDETFKVGFMRWLSSSAAERKEWARRRNAASAAKLRRHQVQLPPGVHSYGKFLLDQAHIQRGFERRPLSGVAATMEDLHRSGGRRAATAARVMTGSVTAAASAVGRIGARQLTITGPDFAWSVEVPANKIGDAQRFAAAVNAAVSQGQS